LVESDIVTKRMLGENRVYVKQAERGMSLGFEIGSWNAIVRGYWTKMVLESCST
jgi:hypothetical protein